MAYGTLANTSGYSSWSGTSFATPPYSANPPRSGGGFVNLNQMTRAGKNSTYLRPGYKLVISYRVKMRRIYLGFKIIPYKVYYWVNNPVTKRRSRKFEIHYRKKKIYFMSKVRVPKYKWKPDTKTPSYFRSNPLSFSRRVGPYIDLPHGIVIKSPTIS